jgi:exopolysaccharide biosynthesis operon protein EpsL
MVARRFFALLCTACWPALALGAFDPTDAVQIEASAAISRDDNLYRLPDVDPRIFGISPEQRSDTVRSLGIGLKFDKEYSRQHVIADLKLTDTKYDDNPQLDSTGYNGSVLWDWQIGNNWDGKLSARRRKYQASFTSTDRRLTTKDLITVTSYSASGGYLFHPRWRIGGGIYSQEYTHSESTRRTSDLESTGAVISLSYRTPSANSIGVELRRNEGEYPNRQLGAFAVFDNNYTENEANAVVAWRLSGATLFNGTIGWTERRHDNFSARDFSGVTGRLSSTWEPTGKLRLTVTGIRDIRTLEDVTANYVLVNSVSVSPAWAVTSKIVLQATLIREEREYLGDPGIVVTDLQTREETLKTASIGVTYSPLRYLDLTLSYQRGDRRSNRPLNDFDYESWFGSLRLKF